MCTVNNFFFANMRKLSVKREVAPYLHHVSCIGVRYLTVFPPEEFKKKSGNRYIDKIDISAPIYRYYFFLISTELREKGCREEEGGREGRY